MTKKYGIQDHKAGIILDFLLIDSLNWLITNSRH